MKNLLESVKKVLMAAAFVAVGGAAQATLIDSSTDNPLTFNWSYDTGGAAGVLTGTGTMSISGFNTNGLAVTVTLSNTSSISLDRLTAFGFGSDPNATAVSFSDPDDGA